MSTTKPPIKPPILRQANATAMLTGSFLETKDLVSVFKTCTHMRDVFGKSLSIKKKASILLKHIFNADPKSVSEFLISEKENLEKKTLEKDKKSKIDEIALILLTRSSCKEEYFSPSKNAHFVKRTWKNISPLEAAAWCGDNFIVRDLLKFLESIGSMRQKEAAEQLQGILDRKETEENGDYLAPYKALLEAYQEYIKQYHLGFNHEDVEMDQEAGGLHTEGSWKQVYLAQRGLPTYGLQEFFDDKPFQSSTAFRREPKRSCTFSFPDGFLFDLDFELFMLHGYALCKGTQGISRNLFELAGGIDGPVGSDSAAIANLCEIRAEELRGIINKLLTYLEKNISSKRPSKGTCMGIQ